MVIPGRALWKFVFHDTGRVYYRPSNKRAVGYFYDCEKTRRPFSIYQRSQSGGWEYVADVTPSDKCQCGRLYTDTFNGREFKWRDSQFLTPRSMAECVNIFTSPVLCQVCYYSKEYKEGRFCPKWVKQQIGVE